MLLGILSDAHGNELGLRAALDALQKAGVDQIYCLGDTVGYGPNPDVCVDLVKQHCAMVLRGNHDEAAIRQDKAQIFNYAAQTAAFWTQDFLLQKGGGHLSWLKRLPVQHTEGDLLFVHASPSDPMDEYIFPDDVVSSLKMQRNFTLIQRGGFCGHTHIPAMFVEDQGSYSVQEAANVGNKATLPTSGKWLVNPGSCGQPRDRNPEACCCVYDDQAGTVEWLRASYDIEEMVKRVAAIPELDDFLGTRLREGR